MIRARGALGGRSPIGEARNGSPTSSGAHLYASGAVASLVPYLGLCAVVTPDEWIFTYARSLRPMGLTVPEAEYAPYYEEPHDVVIIRAGTAPDPPYPPLANNVTMNAEERTQ